MFFESVSSDAGRFDRPPGEFRLFRLTNVGIYLK